MEKTYLLDLDGTVIDSHSAIREAQLDRFGHIIPEVSRSELEQALIGAGLGATLGEYNISTVDFFKQEDPEIKYVTPDAYIAVEAGTMSVFPDAKEFLDNLDEKVAIISNSSQEATERKLDALNISDRFNTVLADYQDLKKPNPELSMRAIRKLGAQEDHVIFCGDQEDDVEVGYNIAQERDYPTSVVLIEREPNKYSGTEPEFIIRSMSELMELEL
jgi:putative hydrolase of the HAD superfamily